MQVAQLAVRKRKFKVETHVKYIPGCGLAGPLILAMASVSPPAWSQTVPEQTAASLEQQGKTTEAEEAWKAVSNAQPANPLPLAHLGLLEARQEHYPQAIAFYRKAMALNPTMPGLHLNLGLAYFKDGQYKKAIEIFTPLLKSAAPNSDETQRLTVLIGMSYYGLGENAAAVPYLKDASGRDAQNLPLLLTLAHSCLLSKQYQCVLDAYHQIIALNANSAEADMLVGEALDEMKDSHGATREFRAAVQANPKEPNVHFGLGYLLWTQNQYTEAAKEFQAEIDNDPQHAQAMLYLADADIQIGHMEDARPLLEKLVKINPASSMGHRDLGIAYAESGHTQEALGEFKKAIALKPDNVSAHWRLGRLYRAMGRTAEAQSEFDKAKSLNESADEGLLKVMARSPHSDSAPQPVTGAPTEK
jgi:tetratricopeptide (TPR) repeat protein